MWMNVSCPYCGESFETRMDEEADESSSYVEDCAVCCRPIIFRVRLDDDGALNATTHRDDE